MESKNRNSQHWYHFNCTLGPLKQSGQLVELLSARRKLLQDECLLSTRSDAGSSDFGWYNLESMGYSESDGSAPQIERGPVLHISPLPWNHEFIASENHIGWKRAPRPANPIFDQSTSDIISLWQYHFWFPQLTHYTVAKYLPNVCDHIFIELWNTLSDCSEFFRRRKNSFHEMDTTSHKVLLHSSFVCVVELGM